MGNGVAEIGQSSDDAGRIPAGVLSGKADNDLRVGQEDIRRIESQQPLALRAVRVVIEDPVPAADHGLRCGAIGESDARRKIVPIRLDQRLILQRSTVCGDKFCRRGIEVCPLEIPFAGRRGELVSQPQVERQRARDSPVVLQKPEVQMLVDIECSIRVLLNFPVVAFRARNENCWILYFRTPAGRVAIYKLNTGNPLI